MRTNRTKTKISPIPFYNCYNRSYVNKKGQFVPYYTSDKYYGTDYSLAIIYILVSLFFSFICIVMINMLLFSYVQIGEKVNGNPDRISINDKEDLLSNEEERELLLLFYDIYDKTGMPITFYTDNIETINSYNNSDYLSPIDVYARKLYSDIGEEENSMVIIVTMNKYKDYYNWDYCFYYGKDAKKCVTDGCYTELITSFKKGLSNNNLYDALVYGWEMASPKLCETYIVFPEVLLIPFILVIYIFVLFILIYKAKKEIYVYKYFKERPELLGLYPMTIYNVCPNCNAPNSKGINTCEYCGFSLFIRGR